MLKLIFFSMHIILIYMIQMIVSVSTSSLINQTETYYFSDNSYTNDLHQAKYKWPVLSLTCFSITGILGNLLVCITIIRDPKLQTKTNYYLFSLAIADLAVCVLVIPLSTIQDFLGTNINSNFLLYANKCKNWYISILIDMWIFGKSVCIFWIFADILLCTCSIYHLTTVSILRFIAIQFPLAAKQTTSSLTTYINLFVIWFISIFISSSVIYLGNQKLEPL
jgi:hypothetical protein